MQKQKIYTILMSLIIVLMLPMFNKLLTNPKTTFMDIKLEDIKSIDLYLQPPNKGIVIANGESIQDIVDELNNLVVKTEESPKVDYNGQLVSYTLNKNNGDKVEVKIYSPYVLIDGKIYKANYKTCDVLNLLGNDLLENNK